MKDPFDYDRRIETLLIEHKRKGRLTSDETAQLRALLAEVFTLAAPKADYEELLKLGFGLVGARMLSDRLSRADA